MNFTIRDVAGISHSVKLSSDKRGLAYDALPRNMSRRPRVARDQELPELPNQIDDDFAVTVISEVLARVGNPDDILAKVQRNLDRSDQNGNDDTGDYTTRTPDHPTPIPGQPQRGGTMSPMSRGAQDAALQARRRMNRREDTMARFPGLRRIGGA